MQMMKSLIRLMLLLLLIFKKICLDKDKLHNYMDSITKELLKVLTESVDKYSEVNICLLRKKGNELSDNSVDSDNADDSEE